jgi:hypothetical protein
VKTWLQQKCGLSDDEVSDFEFMDGATLFSFKDYHDLQKVSKTNYLLARKIVYLRDHQDDKSEMLRWSCEDVFAFIQGATKGKTALSLESLKEKKIDGAAFRALDDATEVELHLGVKAMLAKRILVERDKFLKEELSKTLTEPTVTKCASNSLSQSQSRQPLLVDTTLVATVKSSGAEADCEQSPTSPEEPMETSSVHYLPEDDVHRDYKMFTQRLGLQPVRDDCIKPEMVQCDLRVIYHKPKTGKR